MSLAFGWLARDRTEPTALVIAQMAAALRVDPAQRLTMFATPGVAVGVLEPPPRPGDVDTPEAAVAAGGRFRLWFAGEAFASGDTALRLQGADESRTAAFRQRLLERWLQAGVECIVTLDGEFHVVVWDRDERSVTLINDRFGGLPMYCGASARGQAFAGGVRGVLAAPGVASEPDVEALREAVTFGGFRLDGRTNIAGVHMIGGATAQTLTETGRVEHRYWAFGDITPIDTLDVAPAVESVRDLWRAAIARRLSGSGRHGQTLSGGLDSRAILAEAAPRKSWTAITYGLPECDDARYARRAARAVGAEWMFQPLYEGDWLTERTGRIQETDGLIELGDLMHLESLAIQRAHLDIHLSGYIGDAVSGPTFAAVESLEDAVVGMPYYGTVVSLEFSEACRRVGALADRRAPIRFALFEHKLPQATNRTFTALRPWLRVRKPFVDYAFFDFCQALPVQIRTRGHLHERWLRDTYPECFRSIPNQKSGFPVLTPRWRVNVGRALRRGWAGGVRLMPSRLRRRPRVRSYHDNDRIWRRPDTVDRLFSVIERPGAIGLDVLGRDRVRAVLDGWSASAAAPSQVIGALYVYEAYHAGLGSHLAAARRLALESSTRTQVQGEL